MKKVEKLAVDYVGYNDPNTADEVVLEILGLELAIKNAEQRIALLKLSLKSAEMTAREAISQSEKPSGT